MCVCVCVCVCVYVCVCVGGGGGVCGEGGGDWALVNGTKALIHLILSGVEDAPDPSVCLHLSI